MDPGHDAARRPAGAPRLLGMPGPAVRAATANCAHIRSFAVVARALGGLRADVLGLQEVDRLAFRTGFSQQAGVVARAAGTGHVWAWVRGERIGPGGLLGSQGVGLVVRGGIADLERHDLPRLPFPAGERQAPLTGRCRRVALLARALPAAGLELTVAVAHLSVARPEAQAQLAAVLAALRARPGPHLLLADLNIPLAQADLDGLVPAPCGPTFPRSGPAACIDVVAVAGLEVGPAQVVDLGASDHMAVTAELRGPLPSAKGDEPPVRGSISSADGGQRRERP